MGAPRIKDEVLRYLARHPNVTVWRKDMAQDLNITESRITQAVGSTFRTEAGTAKDHIVVVEQGRAWRWSETPVVPPHGTVPATVARNGTVPATVAKNGTAPATVHKRLFEEIATLPDGRVLVRSDDGKVYWVTEV